MGSKKLLIHEFEPAIYPRTLWVCIGDDLEALQKMFRYSLNEKDEEISLGKNDWLAKVIPVREKETGALGVVVLFRHKKDITFSNAAHEAVHIADYIFDELNAYTQGFSEGDEPYAYLVGWAAKCMGIAKDYRKESV